MRPNPTKKEQVQKTSSPTKKTSRPYADIEPEEDTGTRRGGGCGGATKKGLPPELQTSSSRGRRGGGANKRTDQEKKDSEASKKRSRQAKRHRAKQKDIEAHADIGLEF